MIYFAFLSFTHLRTVYLAIVYINFLSLVQSVGRHHCYILIPNEHVNENMLDISDETFVFFSFFFYLGFLSQTFMIHRTAGEGGSYFFNSSFSLLPTSQTLRPWACNYWGQLNSAHSLQPDLISKLFGFKAQVTNHLAIKRIY